MALYEASPLLFALLLWVQSALVLGLAWAVSMFFGDQQSVLKKRIWLAAVFFLPLLPAMNSLTGSFKPDWKLPWSLTSPLAEELQNSSRKGGQEGATLQTGESGKVDDDSSSVGDSWGRLTGSADGPAEFAGPARIEPSKPIIHGWKWGGLFYLAGAALLLLRIVSGWLGLVWLRQSSRPITEAILLQRFQEVAGARLSRRVSLLCSHKITTPVAIGILRPAIILPEGFLQRDEVQARPVLAHELEHHKRRDPLTLVGLSVVRSLFWPQPLMWMAKREVVALSEILADQGAIEAGREQEYATLLVSLAAKKGAAPAPSLANAWLPPNKGLFLRRIEHILAPQKSSRSGKFLAGVSLVFFAPLLLAAAPDRWISTHKLEKQPVTKVEEMNMNQKKATISLVAVSALSLPMAVVADPNGTQKEEPHRKVKSVLEAVENDPLQRARMNARHTRSNSKRPVSRSSKHSQPEPEQSDQSDSLKRSRSRLGSPGVRTPSGDAGTKAEKLKWGSPGSPKRENVKDPAPERSRPNVRTTHAAGKMRVRQSGKKPISRPSKPTDSAQTGATATPKRHEKIHLYQENNGDQVVKITENGNLVFEGPVNTEKEIERVPKKFRKTVKANLR